MSFNTHKATPQGKAQTIERRVIRAAKTGNVNVKRNGK